MGEKIPKNSASVMSLPPYVFAYSAERASTNLVLVQILAGLVDGVHENVKSIIFGLKLL